MEGDGETVFRHACKLGLEGVVSKRKESHAVKREAEEDWGRIQAFFERQQKRGSSCSSLVPLPFYA
jgi:ATP-dependent DNA ligase